MQVAQQCVEGGGRRRGGRTLSEERLGAAKLGLQPVQKADHGLGIGLHQGHGELEVLLAALAVRLQVASHLLLTGEVLDAHQHVADGAALQPAHETEGEDLAVSLREAGLHLEQRVDLDDQALDDARIEEHVEVVGGELRAFGAEAGREHLRQLAAGEAAGLQDGFGRARVLQADTVLAVDEQQAFAHGGEDLLHLSAAQQGHPGVGGEQVFEIDQAHPGTRPVAVGDVGDVGDQRLVDQFPRPVQTAAHRLLDVQIAGQHEGAAELLQAGHHELERTGMIKVHAAVAAHDVVVVAPGEHGAEAAALGQQQTGHFGMAVEEVAGLPRAVRDLERRLVARQLGQGGAGADPGEEAGAHICCQLDHRGGTRKPQLGERLL